MRSGDGGLVGVCKTPSTMCAGQRPPAAGPAMARPRAILGAATLLLALLGACVQGQEGPVAETGMASEGKRLAVRAAQPRSLCPPTNPLPLFCQA